MRVSMASGAAMRARNVRAGVLAGALTVLAACGGPPNDAAVPSVPATQVTAQATPPPVYPPRLACAGIGGEVILRVSIGTEGKPTDVFTEKGSGQSMLDAAAVTAVRGWQFKPATRGGQPVATKIRVPVTFTPPVMRPDMCFQLDEQ